MSGSCASHYLPVNVIVASYQAECVACHVSAETVAAYLPRDTNTWGSVPNPPPPRATGARGSDWSQRKCSTETRPEGLQHSPTTQSMQSKPSAHFKEKAAPSMVETKPESNWNHSSGGTHLLLQKLRTSSRVLADHRLKAHTFHTSDLRGHCLVMHLSEGSGQSIYFSCCPIYLFKS